MLTSMDVGERLKAVRAELGWSQKRLAEEAGVSQQLISFIETGTTKNSGEIVPIARALGVTADWLYDGREPKYRSDAIYSEVELLSASDQARLAAEIHARLAESQR